MSYGIPISAVSTTAVGTAAPSGTVPGHAAPEAVRRFEQLMYSPTPAVSMSSLQAGAPVASKGRAQMYAQQLSQRWEAGQAAITKMLERGNLSTTELMQAQVRMINGALDVEVSSKCASIFESGVQTLIQRGGA